MAPPAGKPSRLEEQKAYGLYNRVSSPGAFFPPRKSNVASIRGVSLEVMRETPLSFLSISPSFSLLCRVICEAHGGGTRPEVGFDVDNGGLPRSEGALQSR